MLRSKPGDIIHVSNFLHVVPLAAVPTLVEQCKLRGMCDWDARLTRAGGLRWTLSYDDKLVLRSCTLFSEVCREIPGLLNRLSIALAWPSLRAVCAHAYSDFTLGRAKHCRCIAKLSRPLRGCCTSELLASLQFA